MPGYILDHELLFESRKGSLYSILEQDNNYLHVLSEFCFFETRTRSKPNKQHLFIKFYKIIFIKAMTLISNSQNSPKFTTFGMASIKFMIPSCASVTNKVYIPVLLLSSKKPMYYKNGLEYMTLVSSNCFFNEPIIK